jgi:hypothetical protein
MIDAVSREEITSEDLEPLILNEREYQASSGEDEEEEDQPETEVTPKRSKSGGKHPLPAPTPGSSSSRTPPRSHRYPTRGNKHGK